MSNCELLDVQAQLQSAEKKLRVCYHILNGSWHLRDEDEDGEDDDENGEAPKRGQKRLKRSRFVDDIAAVDDQDDDDDEEEEVMNRPSFSVVNHCHPSCTPPLSPYLSATADTAASCKHYCMPSRWGFCLQTCCVREHDLMPDTWKYPVRAGGD